MAAVLHPDDDPNWICQQRLDFYRGKGREEYDEQYKVKLAALQAKRAEARAEAARLEASATATADAEDQPQTFSDEPANADVLMSGGDVEPVEANNATRLREYQISLDRHHSASGMKRPSIDALDKEPQKKQRLLDSDPLFVPVRPSEATSARRPSAPSSSHGPIVPTQPRRRSRVDIAGSRQSSETSNPLAVAGPSTARVNATAETSERQPPNWHQAIKQTTIQRATGIGDIVAKLNQIRDAIKNCINAYPNDIVDYNHFLSVLREHIHDAFFLKTTDIAVRKGRVLFNMDGLPQIFDDRYNPVKVPFPWDIKADAEELYNKWYAGIFETDVLRGIQFADRAAGRNADRIEFGYAAKVDSKFRGNGKLLNGQWWPTQLCAVRDGAHGSSQGGIAGAAIQGAFSIIMSGGHHYEDEDNGDEVWYTGTKGSEEEATENTQQMLESVTKWGTKPVRVIRSAKLPMSNPYRPSHGFRYDGLYDVVEYQELDKDTAHYKFKLIRKPGQAPIRYGVDKPETRPTKQEIEAYQKIRLTVKGLD